MDSRKEGDQVSTEDGVMVALGGPENIWKWVSEHRKQLQPPIGNALMFGRDREFQVMIVAGPNRRTDFHIEDHEEFFYQLKGDINVRIRDEASKKFVNVSVKEGEMFLLPARVPHSPQRPANTLGIVMEIKRQSHEKDALRWYCEKCEEIVHETWFCLSDIEAQLAPIIDEYNGSLGLRTCKKCGHVNHDPP